MRGLKMIELEVSNNVTAAVCFDGCFAVLTDNESNAPAISKGDPILILHAHSSYSLKLRCKRVSTTGQWLSL